MHIEYLIKWTTLKTHFGIVTAELQMSLFLLNENPRIKRKNHPLLFIHINKQNQNHVVISGCNVSFTFQPLKFGTLFILNLIGHNTINMSKLKSNCSHNSKNIKAVMMKPGGVDSTLKNVCFKFCIMP